MGACLTAYREESCSRRRPELYNNLIRNVKANLGVHSKLWLEVAEANLGLIAAVGLREDHLRWRQLSFSCHLLKKRVTKRMMNSWMVTVMICWLHCELKVSQMIMRKDRIMSVMRPSSSVMS